MFTENITPLPYEMICRLAGKDSNGDWEVDYSVPESSNCGSVKKGQAVKPVDGMVFYVSITDNS